MFRRIHWFLTSPDTPTRISYIRSLYVEVHCAIIEYENEKVKPVHYLVQTVDLDDPNDQRRKWFSERQELDSDPALARVIGFYNIYHQIMALIQRGRTLVHCGNTAFIYHSEFGKYMEVEGAASEAYLIISLMLELKNSYQKKERNIFMNYLKIGSRLSST